MKRSLILAGLAASLMLSGADKPGKWHKIFNGKDLTNWEALENKEVWSVKDGAIVGDGERSHIFYTKEQCENCEFKAKIKISDGGNSGMYFRANMEKGWPKGYEAQINSSHTDKVRTGSLYNFVKIFDQLVPPDTWFEQHVIADGNHIQIFVNGKKVVDHVDDKNTFMKGYVAFQQHNKGSVVHVKDIMLRQLPASGKAEEKKTTR